ncbi:MAG: ACT domain-containing protein, partial [Deltaproteobacteria bacterium]|nr:ACT domain-containing protein [Deltaproteobacteria bacterium]
DIHFEDKLWKAADKLRKKVEVHEYKYVVLGLIFLRYLSYRYDEAIKELKKDIGYTDIDVNENIGKVSIVGVGMRTHSGVAAKMFDTLSRHGINIMMINTSEISVSCIIELKYLEMAVRVLHDAFGLENEMNAQLS